MPGKIMTHDEFLENIFFYSQGLQQNNFYWPVVLMMMAWFHLRMWVTKPKCIFQNW